MSRIAVIPLTLPTANRFVEQHHRHHPPLPGGFGWWCVGVVDETGTVRAVAIAGRPTNRNNDDGQTVEVLRVASDGVPNGCSMLLGACAKAARAIGAARIITYTLDEESGASLRAVGWTMQKSGIKSFWTTPSADRSPGRHRAHSDKTKSGWECVFRDRVEVVLPVAVAGEGQDELPF